MTQYCAVYKRRYGSTDLQHFDVVQEEDWQAEVPLFEFSFLQLCRGKANSDFQRCPHTLLLRNLGLPSQIPQARVAYKRAEKGAQKVEPRSMHIERKKNVFLGVISSHTHLYWHLLLYCWISWLQERAEFEATDAAEGAAADEAFSGF